MMIARKVKKCEEGGIAGPWSRSFVNVAKVLKIRYKDCRHFNGRNRFGGSAAFNDVVDQSLRCWGGEGRVNCVMFDFVTEGLFV